MLKLPRLALFLGIMVVLAALSPGAAWAICPSLTDAFQSLSSDVTITVLRDVSLGDNPAYCSGALRPWECNANVGSPSSPVGTDAAGNAYTMGMSGVLDFDATHSGYVLERIDRQKNSISLARFYTRINAYGGTLRFTYVSPSLLDVTNGRLAFAVYLAPSLVTSCQAFEHYGVIEIGGLPALFDILLTFVPTGQTLNALTPGLPDGFRSADSLQLWAGDVKTLPSWSRAQAIACQAATAPAAGERIKVDDPLPNPPVGQARYYLMASQSGTQRRLGRQYVDSAFQARDPALLPVCQ